MIKRDFLWKFFSSVRLGIFLIILIAVATLVGSLLLQRPIAEPGQLERVYSPETIRWLDAFDLLDLFHSWWFLLLLFLLAINITIVSIEMWPRFRARIWSFQPILKEEELPPLVGRFGHRQEPELILLIQKLVGHRFRRPLVHQESDRVHLAAESGKWSHLGVYVIHTGILLILIGGIIGSLGGFEGRIQLSPGEEVSYYDDRKEGGKRVPLGFSVLCHEAKMETYPDGSAKSYESDLEIREEGRSVLRKKIQVNHPLSYKGITFYQATFGQKPIDEKTEIFLEAVDRVTGRRREIRTDFGREEKFADGTFEAVDYRENFEVPLEGHLQNLGPALRLKRTGKEGEDFFWLFRQFPEFDQTTRMGRESLLFKDFHYDYHLAPVTGLQVAHNPGIGITWTGSAILLVGLLATFWIPHRKLWIQVTPQEVLIAATSHRHPESFLKKVESLRREMEEELKPQTGEVTDDPIPA